MPASSCWARTTRSSTLATLSAARTACASAAPAASSARLARASAWVDASWGAEEYGSASKTNLNQ